ncbi:protein LSM14 homolog B isoform X2 [Nelusetta ayraudi]|uniref:protein LSM14 homolog B isoform X2 n=1 Tax=Nelusetta ayraudi TaxID=303726 RepID=UPI003F721489
MLASLDQSITMSSAQPYIGCRIGLISKAQNRYEGFLYTIDRANSTVVLAKVKCFGTEGRPTDRPTPPKDDVYDYITFRGSDIKDITLSEPPRSHRGLPPDPIISSSATSSSLYPPCGSFSPLRMPASYNRLAASPLLNQQYAAALGLHVRRGPMVEKAVQTLHMDRRQRGGSTASQELQWERSVQRNGRENYQARMSTGATRKTGQGMPSAQQANQYNGNENRPPQRRRQGPRRRRNRKRGQLMVANTPSATLKFETDFDFDLSNAQFIKEELEREVLNRVHVKEGSLEPPVKEELYSTADDLFGPKFYYDKAKSFYDNISSDKKFRLTWAEERKRNLETFGVPGRFLGGQGSRGGLAGRRGRGIVQTRSSY